MIAKTTPGSGQYDIIVIGAGLSGINAGYRIQSTSPDSTYTILEGRDALGGTWDLFKYPGIRSDSDLHTFGFPFNPWNKPNPIATGESISQYINATATKFGIDKHVQFRHKVVSADWSSDAQQWRLQVDNEGTTKIYYAKFVIMGTGYYDYKRPLQAAIPGLEKFKGTTIHPQFWPEGLDYKGKNMVIIGSGATAITIMPAVVEGGVGKVTMLQRSPTYVLSTPQKEPGQKSWYDYLPRSIALRLVRLQFIIVPWLFYLFCRWQPTRARKILRNEAKRHLPEGFPLDPHFNPRYAVWDQRLCFCPNSDFFNCFKTGRAHIVTDTIKNVVEDGIELSSGEKIEEVDIIVTATGLSLQFCGNIAISVDNVPVDISERFLWRSSMLTGVPNMGLMIGYINASWTLGSDTAAKLHLRLLKFMKDNNYTSATPQITPEEAKNPRSPMNLTSTYIQTTGSSVLPHAGSSGPWLPRNNYFKDSWTASYSNLRNGLVFKSVST